MDGIALEQREKVETLEKELAEVRRRLERLYYLIEVPDLPPEYGNTAIGTSIWRPPWKTPVHFSGRGEPP